VLKRRILLLELKSTKNSLQSHSQRWDLSKSERECGGLKERAFFLDPRLKEMKNEQEGERKGGLLLPKYTQLM